MAAEFDSDLHRRLSEADFERLEDPEFLDMQDKAKKFIYCDWHGFGYLLDCALTIIGRFFTLIGIAAIIATVNWKIILVFMVFTILSTKIESIAKKKAMRMSQTIVNDQRNWTYFARLFEDFSYGKEIRMNSMGKWLLSKERSYFEKVNNNIKQQNDYYMKAGNWGAFFNFIQQIIAYGYLISCILRNEMTIGSFTMYIGAVTTFAAALKGLLENLTEIRAYDMYYDDLDEYLSTPTTLRQGKKKDIADGDFVIEFKNVSFRYSGSASYSLKNLNMRIRSGEKLSIVGENGAGKTTLVKLLTRLYDPTEGEILLNETDIKEAEYEIYKQFNDIEKVKLQFT